MFTAFESEPILNRQLLFSTYARVTSAIGSTRRRLAHASRISPQQGSVMALREELKIMVVDNMAASRGLITVGLDQIGIKNYDYVKDGRNALSSLSSNPCHLVISDYEMPEMDGLSLLEGLRNNLRPRRSASSSSRAGRRRTCCRGGRSSG